MGNIIFDDFKSDKESKELSPVSKNSGQLATFEPQDMAMSSAQGAMVTAASSTLPFAMLNPKATKACLNTMDSIFKTYSDITTTYITEKEKTKQVKINAMASLEAARIDADARVEESYNNLLSVQAQCEKEIEIARLEFEKVKLKYDAYIKTLDSAQASFEARIKPLKEVLSSFMKEKERYWELIVSDTNLANKEKYFSRLAELDNSILNLTQQIADLKLDLTSLPSN